MRESRLSKTINHDSGSKRGIGIEIQCLFCVLYNIQLFLMLVHQNLLNSAPSAGIKFKLQMTPDGFILIGNEHHLFNCAAGQTDTPAAFCFGCCIGSVASVVSVGLNVPAPLTPCFTLSHLLSPTENPPVSHHKDEELGAQQPQPPKNPPSSLLIYISRFPFYGRLKHRTPLLLAI